MFGAIGEFWGDSKRPVDFFDVKGIVEAVAAKVHVPLTFNTSDQPFLRKGKRATAWYGDRAVASVGFAAKLFAEAIEEISLKQVEAVRATGASFMGVIAYGVLPQVFARFIGFCTYQLDSNLRNSTMVGIVGAGGIGLQLAEQIRVLEWQKVSFLILMILVAVAAIDWISGKLRFAIIGRRAVA